MNKNRILTIVIIVIAIVLASVVGYYAVELSMFLFKAMIGLIAIVIFLIGFFIGKFFPYKSKEKTLLKD
jgi:predicted Na+-dependent transporter